MNEFFEFVDSNLDKIVKIVETIDKITDKELVKKILEEEDK